MEFKRWSEAEEKWLIENYQKLGSIECSKFLNRSKSTIQSRASKLKITIKEKRILKPEEKINRLTLKEKIFQNNKSHWKCVCECGKELIVAATSIKSENTKSCGCYNLERIKIHGKSRTKLYNLWDGIKRRCYNKNCKIYKRYGGRGIDMFHEWKDDPLKFIEYIEENLGECPENHSIDRIDNMRGYLPDNLKWSSPTEQAANRRTTKLNPEKVSEIKKRLSNGEKTQIIAKDFGVSNAVIYQIKNNQKWKYVV